MFLLTPPSPRGAELARVRRNEIVFAHFLYKQNGLALKHFEIEL